MVDFFDDMCVGEAGVVSSDHRLEPPWESAGFLNQILDSIEEGVKIIDRKRRLVYANRANRIRAGMGLDALVKQKCYHAFFNGDAPCHFCHLDQAVESFQPQHGSFVQEDTAGERRHFELSLYPVILDSGQELFIEITREVTDRKILEEQLVRSTRLATLGEVAAGIAHEVRNPLTGIRLGLQSLRDMVGGNPDAMRIIESVASDMSRVHRIVSQLLDFTRRRELRFEDVSPVELLERTLFYIEYPRKVKNVLVERDWREPVPRISADRDAMLQVFLNIALNALEAMPGGGLLRFTIADANASSDGRVRVSISDTGGGIEPENMGRIFDLFFSTREGGTGIGLFTSRKIVEEHGGTIAVESEPGAGTVVMVALPRRDAQTREAGEPGPQGETTASSEGRDDS